MLVETKREESRADLVVRYQGKYYAVAPDSGYLWNRKAFGLLYQLFQMTVAAVPETGPPITISK